MATEEKALVVGGFALPQVGGTVSQAMEEEMDGLTIDFDRVKIPSGGGLAFEVPGDDPDEPDTAKEIVGVILDHYPVNAYWAEKYSGQNNPPDCASLDGKVGVAQEESSVRWAGSTQPCATCPFNQWGSADDGAGKACKNMRRVYILRENDAFPLLLTLPPTSLKNFANYIAKRVVARGLRSHSVVTRVTLKKATSNGGITYSQAQFTFVGTLPPENAQQAAQYAESIKPITRNMAIDMQDVGMTETSYDDDEEEPF